jgi:hypothetical protein
LRYEFFAVRDELIKLVAEEKLSKDDFLFREFYPMVNELIKNIKEIKIERLLKISESQINHMESDEFANKFIGEYEQAPEEVKEVVGQFFASLAHTLICNSNVIGISYILLKTKLSKLVKLFMENVVKILSPPRYNAYQYYNEVQNLKMRLRVS